MTPQEFAHSDVDGPKAGTQILFNESYWEVTAPHVEESGLCRTYNPAFQSRPGWWYGIRQVSFAQWENIFFATMDFFSQKNRHKITTVRKPEPGGKSEWTDEPKNISARKGQVSFLQQVSLCFFDTQSATKLGMPLVTTDFTFSLYLVRGITLILTDLICRHSAIGWLQMLPLNIVCQQL